jgi:hypothetical protein
MSALIFIPMFVVGHMLVWTQSNGQFKWDFFKNNLWFTCLMGLPLSYIFITATKLGYEFFGNLWPLRIIGFSIGTIVFSFMTFYFMGEGLTPKTIICILLSVIIILVQVLM